MDRNLKDDWNRQKRIEWLKSTSMTTTTRNKWSKNYYYFFSLTFWPLYFHSMSVCVCVSIAFPFSFLFFFWRKNPEVYITHTQIYYLFQFNFDSWFLIRFDSIIITDENLFVFIAKNNGAFFLIWVDFLRLFVCLSYSLSEKKREKKFWPVFFLVDQ